MSLTAVLENQANAEVKNNYQKIKEALEIAYLPLFFTYIGGFPEYLSYLTDQISPNLNSSKFEDLIRETEERIFYLIKTSLIKSDEMDTWVNRYRNSPSFYNFQKDLKKIFTVNLKLALIFVALREALKGWAIAAKKLSPKINSDKSETPSDRDKDFIFEDALSLVAISSKQNSDLEESKAREIEKDLLPRYIVLCEQEYHQLMKSEKYLILRVGIEKVMLSTLPLLPEKIVSPINVFYDLTEKYEDFPELLYLMYEHFPTLAVQKMMFSGFMKS